ncbi:hypothetical protein EQZ23_17745 [Sphingomonas sp. UV9]|uniref:PAS domain-containing protein n=1 Tax=Sphingomonas sp. UV9 TaxID=1851410 RepID=UPI000FFC3FB3|nr:hypothetical protein [Sphingomonas sp. UV9]RXD02468.1 hypothetical protein EQZ23_17745 [Sphingomonas sp. UV9]
MDTVRGRDDGRAGATTSAHDAADAGVNDVMFDLGGDERRMHVRAYNHWVSLLDGRPYPSIANLEPETITDFGPHSVLLDFSHGMGDPKIAYLGRALREECGLEGPIATIADVPPRSLLSRLTDHYLQIIANRAPIGFEAEFVSSRGRTTLYRGILMPFASAGETIDFIFGVINWKELADADMQATLSAELDAAVRATPQASGEAAQVWADGPSGGFDSAAPAMQELVLDEPLSSDTLSSDTLSSDTLSAGIVPNGPLGEQLAMARESAAHFRAAEARGRAALQRALSRAHDFAVAAEHEGDDLAALLSVAGLPGESAAMAQIVQLVFGANFEAGRLSLFTDVLRHARRHQVPVGGLPSFLDGYDGDLSAIAAAAAEHAAT